MHKSTVRQLQKSIQEFYDTAAAHWSETRVLAWPEFDEFMKYLTKHCQVLDFGCGNGRLIPCFKQFPLNYTGLDISQGLIEICQKKYPERKFIVHSETNLPFPDCSFDVVFCLATLHHFPSKELRIATLKELQRILKPGGYLCMTNWNLWQWRYQKYLVKNLWQRLRQKNDLDWNDALIPWTMQKPKTKLWRYCHAFTHRELTQLAGQTKFSVLRQYYSRLGAHASLTAAFNLLSIWQKI